MVKMNKIIPFFILFLIINFITEGQGTIEKKGEKEISYIVYSSIDIFNLTHYKNRSGKFKSEKEDCFKIVNELQDKIFKVELHNKPDIIELRHDIQETIYRILVVQECEDKHELLEITLPASKIINGENSLAFHIPHFPQRNEPYVYIYELVVDIF